MIAEFTPGRCERCLQNIDEHYEDMKSLNKLDVTHTLRCQKHETNCALQNIFKLFNWWHQRHQK